MNAQLLLTAAVGAVISAAMLAVVVPWLQRGDRFDIPGERSSHSVPVPRGAGAAVAVALLAAGVVTRLAAPGTAQLWTVIVVSLMMAALGLIEDFRGVSIARRLVGQAVIAIVGAIWLVAAGHRSVLLVLPIAMAILIYVNATNFMDGVNGISGLHGAVAGAVYIIIGDHVANSAVEFGAAALLGCCLGFLPWNSPRARVFLGDSGSYLIGAAVSTLAVSAMLSGAEPEVTLAPASVYLADVAWTLVRRRCRGERLLESHRSHVYQRLAIERGHLFSAATVTVAAILVAALTAVGDGDNIAVRLICDGAAIITLILYLLLPTLLVGRPKMAI